MGRSASASRTPAGSSFTMGVSGGDAQATVKNISVAGSFGNITIPGVNISGNVTIGGTLARPRGPQLHRRSQRRRVGHRQRNGRRHRLQVRPRRQRPPSPPAAASPNTLSSKVVRQRLADRPITAPLYISAQRHRQLRRGPALSLLGPSGSPVLGKYEHHQPGRAQTPGGRAARSRSARPTSTSARPSPAPSTASDHGRRHAGRPRPPRFQRLHRQDHQRRGSSPAPTSGATGDSAAPGLNADSPSLSVGSFPLRRQQDPPRHHRRRLDLVNGVFDDGDDFIRGGVGSKLGPVTVVSATTLTTRFLAGKYTAAVSINGAAINPKNDRRFVLTESAPRPSSSAPSRPPAPRPSASSSPTTAS